MADITDPVFLKFVREIIRPLAKNLAEVDLELQVAKEVYASTAAGLIAGNVAGDLVEDGRAEEGISRLTKADIQAFLSAADDLVLLFGAPGVRDEVRKPSEFMRIL